MEAVTSDCLRESGLKRLAWGVVAALGIQIAAVPVSAVNIRITVLHTNDIHGGIMPRPAVFYEKDPQRLIGGAAALAAYVKKVKGPKILLDAGDWFQGTPEGALRGGQALAGVFNAVGYDALEVGNHEFDNGEKNLQEMIQELKAPVLCANVYHSVAQHASECKPWVVKDVAGVKIGIFGLLSTRMETGTMPESIAGLTFRRGIDEARGAVAALRDQGATVIIALTHQGFESPSGPAFEGDRTLAAQVEGIDLIVGGHTHTVLERGVRDETHGTLIVQAGADLTCVGEVTLEIDPGTKKVVQSSARIVELWLDVTGSAPVVVEAVAKISRDVQRLYDVVVATAVVALTRNRDGESALGDWVTDCERDWAGTDLALQNGGVFRNDIPAGPVTLRSLFYAAPYGNKMVKLVMKGKNVKSLLDQAVGMARMGQISGARVTFHRHAPPGHRLESVRISGKELVDESTYTVATVDFLVKGGDGYTAFAAAVSKDFTNTTMRDVMQGCALKKPRILPPPADRLVLLGD